VIDITYPNVESAPLGILRDQEGDLLVKRESEQIAWLRTSGNWRALPRSWYPTLVGIRLPLRLVAPLPAELTDEALRAAAEGRTAERVEPYPEVGDRVRPEDLARLPVGAVVDNTRDGTGAPLIVRGPAGWGWGNACKGERLPDSPQWGDSISSGAMSRQVGDKAVLVGLGLEGARGRAFDEGLAAQGYQPAIAAGAGAAAAKGDAADAGGGMMDALKDMMLGSTGPRGGRREGLIEKAASSAVRSMGSRAGRELIRGVLGSLLGGKAR